MASKIKCPCCRQAQSPKFTYDGGVKEWFKCPKCYFECGGKTLADEQALAQAVKEYKDKSTKDLGVAKARDRVIKQGNK